MVLHYVVCLQTQTLQILKENIGPSALDVMVSLQTIFTYGKISMELNQTERIEIDNEAE